MKKRNTIALITLVVFTLMILASCGSSVSVKDDLINYKKNTASIIKSFSELDSTPSGTTPAEIQASFEKFISQVDALTDKLKAIKVETTEVKELHEKYISGIEKVVTFLNAAMDALAKKDLAKLNSFTDEYNTLTKEMKDLNTKFTDLAKKNGIDNYNLGLDK